MTKRFKCIHQQEAKLSRACIETANITTSKIMEWLPSGVKRGRGRPKKTWRRKFEEVMNLAGLTFEQATETAQNSLAWRDLVDQCFQWNRRN